MPEISEYCPACGRSVRGDQQEERAANETRDALLGSLAYIGVVPAIVLLVIPAMRRIEFIRFHSWQSVLFAIAAIILGFVMRVVFVILSLLPAVGFLFAWLSAGVVFLGVVVCWAVLVVKAGQGYVYELPLLGRFAWRLSGREQI